MLRARGERYSRLIEETDSSKGTMLDIGAAAGFIMQGFADAGWDCVGLEPNASMVKAGKEQFGADIRQGSLEEFDTDEKFDLISIIQVAGHFYDPGCVF